MVQIVLDVDIGVKDVIQPQQTSSSVPTPPGPPRAYIVPPSSAQPAPSAEPAAASKDFVYGGKSDIADGDADKPGVYKFAFVEEKVDYAKK
jgi:hypothetical protein